MTSSNNTASSNQTTVQEQATGLAYAAKDSEVCVTLPMHDGILYADRYPVFPTRIYSHKTYMIPAAVSAVNSVQNSQVAQDLANG